MFYTKTKCEFKNILDEFIFVMVDCEDLNGDKKRQEVCLDPDSSLFYVARS